MTIDLSALRRGIDSMDRAVHVVTDTPQMELLSEEQQETIRAGVIQNFEFTYELCWRHMKRWIEENIGATYVDGVTRRQLFRHAIENQLISDVDLWMKFHEARNKTSHTYNEETAEAVLATALEFMPSAKALLEALESRND